MPPVSIKRITQLSYRALREVWRVVTKEDARDGKYVRSFVSAMNEKARRLGANDSLFIDPAGYDVEGSKATAHDLLVLFAKALENESIREILSTKEYSIKIDGIYKRVKKIETTVKGQDFDEGIFPIIAGKTGTSPGHSYNLLMLTRLSSGERIVCSILGSLSDERRWKDAYALVGYADKLLSGEDASVEVSASYYEISEYPSLRTIAAKSPDNEEVPASLTKIATALTAVDFIDEWDQRVTIHSSDRMRGSGNHLYIGDVVTVRDLFYDMLLPSGNSAARTLARYLGRTVKLKTKV